MFKKLTEHQFDWTKKKKEKRRKRKILTKPSGFTKRWRVSFCAVFEHSHSALNGSPVTSEKWTWGALSPSLMYRWMAWGGGSHEGEGAGAGGHNSKTPPRCVPLTVIGEEAAFPRRFLAFLLALTSVMLLIVLWVPPFYTFSLFKAASTVLFPSLMSEKLLPLIIPGWGSRQEPLPFAITAG